MTKKTSRRKKKSRSWRWEFPFDRVLVYLIAFFAFAMPLFIWPGITEYGYAKSIFTLVGVSILLILWGASFWSRREWRLRLPWITFPVLGVVVVSLLSLLWATNGRVVVQSLTLVVFFFLFALVVSNVVKEKRDITLILYALLLSAFFASLYGMLQYLGVMRGAAGGPGLSEVISTMGNRNYLGGFLSYLLFPAVVLIVRLRSRLLRSLAIGLLSFNFGMIMLVQQTGTKVALVGGVVALFIAWAIFRPIEPIRRNRAWLIALLLVLVFTFLVEAPSGPLNSAVGLSADSSSWFTRYWAREYGNVRSWDWWVGWEMFKDSPLVGVGLGNYKLNFIPYKAKFLATPGGAGYDFYIPRAAQAHNEYVQVVAELGVLGILATLALLGVISITFWRRLRRNTDEGDRLDLILFGCGIVVFLLHALVSFPAHLPASSLVVVLVFGLASSRAYGDAAEVAVYLKGWPKKTVIGILVALCLVVSVVAARDYSADRLLNRGVMQLQMGQIR
ncbi:MAG TPA: O-antigen ligase family protein, partial [Candidatus Heimdallarchaeota archaeon]|nr:O-antigen ligase family protein [Candidatus Heimdallarchaeota archaeon]